MNRAVGEVGQPFGMVEHEAAAAAFMAGIGRRRGIATSKGVARPAGAIAPAKPPLPGTTNLPFQPDAGIQSSILISESALGIKVAVTRQKAGRSANGDAAAPPGPLRPCTPTAMVVAPRADGTPAPPPRGAVTAAAAPPRPAGNGTNAPASTRFASVIVARGSVNEVKLSHDAAPAGATPSPGTSDTPRNLSFEKHAWFFLAGEKDGRAQGPPCPPGLRRYCMRVLHVRRRRELKKPCVVSTSEPVTMKEMTFMKFMLTALFLVGTALHLSAQSPAVTFVGHEKVAEALAKGGGLVTASNLTVSGNHRSMPGQVEVHDKETDILYIIEGRQPSSPAARWSAANRPRRDSTGARMLAVRRAAFRKAT